MSNSINIQAQADGAAVINVYGPIGESLFEESLTARDMISRLQAIQAQRIDLYINSPGGSVADALAIVTALQRHPATVTAHVDGVAASSASYLLTGADRVLMADNAMLMIHSPWSSISGNATELREHAEVLERFARTMADGYARLSGQKLGVVEGWMAGETWFTAQEAVDAGLAHEINAAVPAAALARFTGELNMPEANQPSAATKPAAVNANEVIALEQKRIQARNEAITARFRPFQDHEGVQAVYHACLADVTLTVDQAGERLLAKLGEGAAPLGGGRGGADIQNHDGGRIFQAAAFGGHGKDEFLAACGDAMLVKAGIPVKAPHPGAADVRSMTTIQIAAALVDDRGFGRRGQSPDQVLRAAHTSSDLPLLLSNTVSKALMVGYENAAATHRVWTRSVDIADFKPVSRIKLSEVPELKEIPEADEYHEGALSEKGETYSLATYGRLLSFTRQALINDDLDALRVAAQFGAAGARLESDKVYALLTGNPSLSDGIALFHADHDNIGTGAALSVTALGEARSLMRRQKGLAGKGFIDPIPRYLVVPVAIETAAEQLLASLVDPAKSNSTDNPAWVRGLELVADPRLDENSATRWYLAADTSTTDTVECGYLAGQRSVESEEEVKFESDAYRVKARLDFGCQVLDYVGLVMNDGS